MNERAIRSVAVLGGGITGLSGALAFVRALPQVQVTLIRTPPDPAALADRMPGTLPSVARFHEAIGLAEADLIRTGAATWRLGTRFENWSADGEPRVHAYGDYGLPAGLAPFHQLWAQARRLGRARPFHAYSAGGVLAEAGKFVHPEADARSPLSTYDYALRLDPERYLDVLRTIARQTPLTQLEGDFGAAERRADGGIAAILLADRRRVEADLFLDCSGPAAPLLSALGADFEDWSSCLPCDRLLLDALPNAEPASSDTVTAIPIGWQWSAPLRERTLSGLSYSSAITAEHEARAVIDGELVAIRPGRRRKSWISNVVAIGDAAVTVDPLESANLHLAQSAILRAIELVPGRDCALVEVQEYNRRTELETAAVRDFLALHYLRSGRREGLFWSAAARLACPESLARTLQQFENRGRLPFREEDGFAKESWLAVLCGMGVLPRHVDPVAAGVELDGNLAVLDGFADDLAALQARLPRYADYLGRVRS